MKDSAEPFDSWNLSEILNVDSGLAINDVDGKLFNHLQTLFFTFIHRLSTNTWEFQLLNVNAADLPNYLADEAFARIEVIYYFPLPYHPTKF